MSEDIISISLSERDENLYDVIIYFNYIKYMAVYSPVVGFMYCSLEDKEVLAAIVNEIEKKLRII